MNKEDILKQMEGLDKRTKEYKELKKQLTNYKVSDEVYETISSWYGKVPSDKLKWLFDTYNSIFDTKIEKCLCGGKIKRMIFKLKRTYEKERE